MHVTQHEALFPVWPRVNVNVGRFGCDILKHPEASLSRWFYSLQNCHSDSKWPSGGWVGRREDEWRLRAGLHFTCGAHQTGELESSSAGPRCLQPCTRGDGWCTETQWHQHQLQPHCRKGERGCEHHLCAMWFTLPWVKPILKYSLLTLFVININCNI